MAVYHVLKDGSRTDDIRDHVVKLADADPLYRYILSVNQGSSKNTYKVEKVGG